MRRSIFDIPSLARPLGRLARLILRLSGWRLAGPVPDAPKCVAVVAPHTSNWDFPIAILCAFGLDLKVSYLGKAELFRWPVIGPLFYLLGGIPVQRDRAQDVVRSVVREFEQRDHLVLGIAPEGTRKKVTAWKTGFYRIAVAAHVPIALAFIDYRRKEGGFGPTLHPTGDLDADMKTIADFYAGVTALRPELTGPPTATSLGENGGP